MHTVMLEFGKLLRHFQDEVGRKRKIDLEISKVSHYGNSPDPLNTQVQLTFDGVTVIGADPFEVFEEVLRRAGWQKRQDALQLAAPAPERAAQDAEFTSIQPAPNDQADDDIPF